MRPQWKQNCFLPPHLLPSSLPPMHPNHLFSNQCHPTPSPPWANGQWEEVTFYRQHTSFPKARNSIEAVDPSSYNSYPHHFAAGMSTLSSPDSETTSQITPPVLTPSLQPRSRRLFHRHWCVLISFCLEHFASLSHHEDESSPRGILPNLSKHGQHFDMEDFTLVVLFQLYALLVISICFGAWWIRNFYFEIIRWPTWLLW